MIGNVKYINDYGGEVEFSFAASIVIGSITGFTENYITPSTSQGFNQIGSTVQGMSVQEKPIVAEGTIMGHADYNAALLLNTILPGIKSKLIYNDTWEMTVYPTQTPVVSKHTHNPAFQFELRAPYPYWRKIKESTTSLSGIEAMFVFWDLTQPYQFGKRIDRAFTTVYNEGNVEIPYTAIFRATALGVKNPKIINAETYEFLRIKRDMNLGEVITVTIAPDGLSVLSNTENVISDIIGRFDIQSDLYRLHPGDNVFAYDADSGRDDLDITIVHSTESVWVRT